MLFKIRIVHQGLFLIILLQSMNVFAVSPKISGLNELPTVQNTEGSISVKSAAVLSSNGRYILGESMFEVLLSSRDWRKFHPLHHIPFDQNLVLGEVEGERLQAIREYTNTFPESYEEYDDIFGYGAPLGNGFLQEPTGEDYIHIELYFDLFDYADKGKFISKVFGITNDAPSLNLDDSNIAYFQRELRQHFELHIDDYIVHAPRKKDAILSFLEFFILDNHFHHKQKSQDDIPFHHLSVEFGIGEICLTDSFAMMLCTSVGLIDIPLFEDIVNLLECEKTQNGVCVQDNKETSASLSRLLTWGNSNLHLLDNAFNEGKDNTFNFVPMFYIIKRYHYEEFKELALLEAKLYINHPKLSMRWLALHRHDFNMARNLGDFLFPEVQCEGRWDGPENPYVAEARRLGGVLIARTREYLDIGRYVDWSYPAFSTYAYSLQRPLFNNRNDVKELLKYWEESMPQGPLDYLAFCEQQRQQQ